MQSFEQLVFEGGGVKGIAYAGAIMVLEEQKCLHQVKHVAGSSVGSLVALLVSLSYSSADVERLLKIDFQRFQDGPKLNALRGAAFLKHWGIHPGEYLHALIAGWVEEKLGNANATFEDLHKKVLLEANKELSQIHYRDVHLYVADLNTRRPVLLSYYTTPTLPLVEAIRASAAMPGFFQPTKSIIDGQTHYWVDGGLICNYPIRLFDSIYPNAATLGLRVDSAAQIEQFVQEAEAPAKPLKGLGDYFGSILSAAMYAQDGYQAQENYRTVYIDTLDVETTDFNLTPTKQAALIQSGRVAMERFLAQARHAPELKDPPPVLKHQMRLGKHDRYHLYKQAMAVWLQPAISNAATGQIQWLFLISADISDDWNWQRKINRYVQRLKQQPEILQLTQARVVQGFMYQDTPCQGWVVIATVSPGLIAEGMHWLEKYGQTKERLNQPIPAEQYIIQQQFQHQQYPKWMMAVPADIAARERIFQAIDSGNKQAVTQYLASGGAVAIKDTDRQDYLLHTAVYRLNELLVGLLLNRVDTPITIDGTNKFGDTPLHTALFHRNPSEEPEVLAIVQLLLQHHAHPNIQNKDGQTPLMFAVENEMELVIRLLLSEGATVTLRDNRGQQAIDYLPRGKHLSPEVDEMLRGQVRVKRAGIS